LSSGRVVGHPEVIEIQSITTIEIRKQLQIFARFARIDELTCRATKIPAAQ
jgi:hypothetical protein